MQILSIHLLHTQPVKHNIHFCNDQVYVSRLVHLQSGCVARITTATTADSEIHLATLAKVSSEGTGTKSSKFTEEQGDIGESLLY
jgi:hypothetical protein